MRNASLRFSLFAALALSLFFTEINTQAVLAQQTRYVSNNGNDFGASSPQQPWRTLRYAFRNLNPGDTLIIEDGTYDEGEIFVRRPDLSPLFSDNLTTTTIRARNRRRAKLIGNIDIRGSYITIDGLEVLGRSGSDRPGIACYFSHHISILNCYVHRHGGGGINLNHSDWLLVDRCQTEFNANFNTSQHSGISVFQPVDHGDDPFGLYYGIVIQNCISNHNRNFFGDRNGQITDGNGIILDDFRYQISTPEINSAPFFGNYQGRPLVQFDGFGGRQWYPRPSLVRNNVCHSNGGRGIHLFLSNNIEVNHNTCFGNLQSPEIAFRSNTYSDGELSVIDSTFVYLLNNIAVSNSPNHVAAAEHRFQIGSAFNVWGTNLLWNTTDSRRLTSETNVFGNVDPPAANNVKADPGFADLTAFNLRDGSPAINRATTFGRSTDANDRPRPSFSRGFSSDIGAFEFQR